MDINIFEMVHISQICVGDCIEVNSKPSTVCKKDIQCDSFWGVSIFGDSYRSGTILVKRFLFKRFYSGQFKGLYPQN